MSKRFVKFATIPLAKVGHMALTRISVGGQYQRVQMQRSMTIENNSAVNLPGHSNTSHPFWEGFSNIHWLFIQQFHSAGYLRKIPE